MLRHGDQEKEESLCVTGKRKDDEITAWCCLPYPEETQSYPGQKQLTLK